MINDFYVKLFVRCQKCGNRIEPKNGYWHWQSEPPLKGGYYHPECGMLNNQAPTGFFPFPTD